jgi:hypothetical protein
MAKAVRGDEVELARARYGLLAVVSSNLAIVAVALVGVWQLDGDNSVIVGVLTAAFTAVGSMTTAYLGIKAVSNTAKTIVLDESRRRREAETAAETATAAVPSQGSGDAA